MTDEDDFFLDLGELDVENLFNNEQTTDESIQALNSAQENLASRYASLNRNYTKIRPDPNLDYSILDECGVAGYDVFFVGSAASDMRLIIEAFLTHVKDDFYDNGIGTYDCIWRLRGGLGRFDEERVKRTTTAWRASVRRVRDSLQPNDNSVFTVIRSQILPDNLHVAVSLGRMTPEIYHALDAKRRSQAPARTVYLERVKSLI